MAISLYQHNGQAYLAATKMLMRTGKAAVIHPTGTGKSFIAFKLCEDNPEKTICWISPSEYVYRTQIENLKEAGGAEPANVRFYTYAKLTRLSDGELDDIKPDFIVLDEFHRCGAAVWGKGVEALFTRYPEAKLLGLSATAVRYLDNQRDMSDELFDGNVASEMSLGEAIVRGILNPPKYVLSTYAWQDSILKYQVRIDRLRGAAVRARAEKLLENLRRALTKAEGLNRIFAKYEKDPAAKYLLFCSDFEHMRECMAKVPEWFGEVDKAPHVYSIYSEDAASEEQFRLFKADDDPEHLKLLFCIDALNEGVHVEGVSGVILLRPTISPIVYKQQIGRALSASKKTKPIIFDMVNNVQNLYSIDSVREEMQEAIRYFETTGESGDVVNEGFEISDELGDCLELFQALEQSLTASWEANYEEAKKYYEDLGNLMVPLEYITDTGFRLGRWIAAQRAAYAKKELRGQAGLNTERIRKLEAIGMCWQNADERAWDRSYRAAAEYYRKNGNLDIPTGYVTEEGISLGRWYRSMRDRYQDGSLTGEKIEALERIGMQWSSIFSRRWAACYELAKKYREEHGDLVVPKTYVTEDGTRLGIWICGQRDAYAKGRLTEAQIKSLEELGMSWDRSESKWEQGYNMCLNYVREHGDVNTITESYQFEGFRLGQWLRTQRTRYGDGKLSKERTERLEALGIRWSLQEALWEGGFGHAQQFVKDNGSLKVPTGYECEDGFKLKTWLNNQAARHRNGKMPLDQAQRLENIGMKWGRT
jgi:superfamily II DNA or RNA helicase